MKLVKFSLGVKNGFQVNSSELFQLLRRCREMNLHTNLQTKQSILVCVAVISCSDIQLIM